MTNSLVLLQLSKIVILQLQNKLVGVEGFDNDKPLTFFIRYSLPGILRILIFNPINILQNRLIVQEIPIVDVKDEDDKESLKTYDTVSNLRKCKYNGIFDCIRKIKE